jgi:hypothetical protein
MAIKPSPINPQHTSSSVLFFPYSNRRKAGEFLAGGAPTCYCKLPIPTRWEVPISPFGHPSPLSPWRPIWRPRDKNFVQEIDGLDPVWAVPTPPQSPAAPSSFAWKQSTSSTTPSSSPWCSDPRGGLAVVQGSSERRRRPPPGPLPRRSWPPWNPKWASPLSFLLHHQI